MANTHFKANEYELLQIHRLKFKDADEHLKMELKKAEQEMKASAEAYKKTGSDSEVSKMLKREKLTCETRTQVNYTHIQHS